MRPLGLTLLLASTCLAQDFNRYDSRLVRDYQVQPNASNDYRFGQCGACGRTWNRVDYHVTNYRGGGMFCLCKDCWAGLTPEQRLPHYRLKWDAWKADHDSLPVADRHKSYLVPWELLKRQVLAERTEQQTSLSIDDVVAQLGRAVCLVESQGAGGGVGSGVLLDGGWVLTAKHVTVPHRNVVCYFDGNPDAFRVTRLFYARDCDCAVLKINPPDGIEPCRIASQAPTHGETVYLGGYDGSKRLRIFDGQLTINRGRSDGSYEVEHGPNRSKGTMNAVPGDSGGPVWNTAGEVVAPLHSRSAGPDEWKNTTSTVSYGQMIAFLDRVSQRYPDYGAQLPQYRSGAPQCGPGGCGPTVPTQPAPPTRPTNPPTCPCPDGGCKCDLSEYAKKSELPDLSGYAKKDEIPAPTPPPDLSKFVIRDELPDVPELPDLSKYATDADIRTLILRLEAIEKRGAPAIDVTLIQKIVGEELGKKPITLQPGYYDDNGRLIPATNIDPIEAKLGEEALLPPQMLKVFSVDGTPSVTQAPLGDMMQTEMGQL